MIYNYLSSDKPIEIGLKNKESTAANVHHNPQALWKPE